MLNEPLAPELKPAHYRSKTRPIWCPGCGHYSILASLVKALAYLAIPKKDVALISGIGCSSRLPAYTSVYGFHGVHGRALPVAAGLKAARPDLTVLVAGGDGDGFSIGGNHFLHACRRNMDMTYIMMDNEVYGMTKGQASPTTAPDWTKSKLTPEGPGIPSFIPAGIALGSGATFFARGFANDPNGTTKLLVEAIQHPGFAFVQILSPCTTFRPEQKDWKSMVHAFEEEATDDRVETAKRITADDGMSTGILFRSEIPVMQPSNISRTDIKGIERGFHV